MSPPASSSESSHGDAAPVRVLLVDDDPLVRSALGLMLGGRADLRVVGEAGDGLEALEAAERLTPDVVLMDIRMPRLDGLEATRRLQERGEAPHVIVLTTFDADDQVVGALGAGADGFLLKDTPPARLVEAVLAVAAGEPMLSPSVTRTLIERLRDVEADPPADAPADARQQDALARLAGLTDRESEVARAVGRGLSNAEIARELHLSVPTVKAHVSRLLEKLATSNRTQIAICVHDAGWV
ncbi:response regulator transcription factor [Nocardioides sp. TRM66260-LWL]|uniref:response regulator n=1 Tax=Nocardioides sp. TRM66260-LWL TaxID=2874478 RepID=UPI001CC65758|nr:response regulator transcription factor [Nocardioides sp. TRM66260-LWL]MBZ5732948.1 response regulator transcription factor [Nocardioides sp. TRM66260-LWL]